MTSEAEQRAIREAVDHGPILIWGAGAIGGTLGAALVRARYAVVFVDIVEDHVAAIRDQAVGLTIEGPVDPHRISAPAYTPATLKGQFRRVLLCVKAQDTEAACHAIAPHLAPDGYVVSLQNGLCEALISPILGDARTIGCFVNFSADWLGPGRIMYGGRGALVLGELNGEVTPRLTALHRMLRDHFEPDAIMTENIWGYLWGKIAYSSMLYTQALGEKGIADALARPELLPVEWQADVALAQGNVQLARIVADYVAGMTDRFALAEGGRLLGAGVGAGVLGRRHKTRLVLDALVGYGGGGLGKLQHGKAVVALAYA
jgi:2-dehydropantoate 2-reductase